MTKYSNYKKAVKLTPNVAELMYTQKEYGYNECGKEFGLWK